MYLYGNTMDLLGIPSYPFEGTVTSYTENVEQFFFSSEIVNCKKQKNKEIRQNLAIKKIQQPVNPVIPTYFFYFQKR